MALDLALYKGRSGPPLSGLIWEPETPGRTVVILTPGGFGGVAGPHDFRPAAKALNDAGFAFMFINMRTAYSFLDPDLHNCVDDIGAAVDEAARRNYDDVILMGCSLGGPRTLLYAASEGAKFRGVVLVNSIPSPYEESLQRNSPENQLRLNTALAEAKAMVDAGKGKEIYNFRDWYPDGRGIIMTARGFVNVYGSPDLTDISVHRTAPAVTTPALVIHGTEDEISLPPNAQTLYDAFENAQSRDLVWVDGGPHYWGPGEMADRFGEVIGTEIAKRFQPLKR